MPTATFATDAAASLRGAPAADQTKNFRDFYDLGVQSLGGACVQLEGA